MNEPMKAYTKESLEKFSVRLALFSLLLPILVFARYLPAYFSEKKEHFQKQANLQSSFLASIWQPPRIC